MALDGNFSSFLTFSECPSTPLSSLAIDTSSQQSTSPGPPEDINVVQSGEPGYHNSAYSLDCSSRDILISWDVPNDWRLVSKFAGNLSFSGGILGEHQSTILQCIGQRTTSMVYTPLETMTIAPSVTTLASSPCEPEPTEENEFAEQILDAMPITPKVRRSGGRGNTYRCQFPGCVNKNGFKRPEHVRRHVDTVHHKKKQFRCWVPGCTTKPFTRSDNLTTHLRTTHGKKSVSSRNRYVSTLDCDSDNFDPEWRGDLDDNGDPVITCGIVPKWRKKSWI